MQHYFTTLLAACLLFFSCKNEEPVNDNNFRSNWANEKNIVRPWAGGEYWLNPLQAWEQKDGKLNVVASGGDRNCVLLTRQLNGQGEHFEMEVGVQKISENDTSGWAGFQIGLQGQFDDYRDDAVHGRGFCVGVTNDGFLFIGNKKEKINVNKIPGSFRLHLKCRKISAAKYSLMLAYHHQYGEQVMRNEIHHSWLEGLVALTSSEIMPDSVNIKQEKPWFGKVPVLKKKAGGNTFHTFSNWLLTGDLISNYNNRSFGPIMWAQHTLSNNVLKMSVQFAPIGNDRRDVYFLQSDPKKSVKAEIDSLGNNALFKIENWDGKKDQEIQIQYNSIDKRSTPYPPTRS